MKQLRISSKLNLHARFKANIAEYNRQGLLFIRNWDLMQQI